VTPTHRLGWFALVSLLSIPALADERAGRGLWLRGEIAGVWVGPRRMWVPATGEEVLSVCGPRGGCAPVVSQDACAVPACPGDGTVLMVERDVASVGDYPQDYDGYRRELQTLREDPALTSIHGHLRDHPDHGRREGERARREHSEARERSRRQESVRWVSTYRDHDRLELSFTADAATMFENGGSFLGGTATGAFVFLSDADESDDSDDDDGLFNLLVGDQIGAELRVHFLHRADGGASAEWATMVGIGPALANRFERSVLRLPTIVGTIIPEVGVALRADRDPTWYAAWSFPVSVMITHDLAFDAIVRAFWMEDWEQERTNEDGTTSDPAEGIVSISLGLRII
jgi:hypothetical protein